MYHGEVIPGFPKHPHRGFETVTYMLEGRMLHEDHLGNRGLLGPGGVQWMTAGRGIIHSEMPQQDHGTMRGFQLWLNLPAAEKMQPAHYQDLPPEAMATLSLSGGGQLKLIAGSLALEDQTVQGPIHGGSTQPLYVDLHLGADEQVQLPTPAGHTALLYVYEGAVSVGDEKGPATLTRGQLGLLNSGEKVNLTGQAADTRLLLMAVLLLTMMTLHQILLVLFNRTSIEPTDDRYDISLAHNWRVVFGRSAVVWALPVTGGLNADQLAKQQASPGVSVTANPQQAQKHSVAI